MAPRSGRWPASAAAIAAAATFLLVFCAEYAYASSSRQSFRRAAIPHKVEYTLLRKSIPTQPSPASLGGSFGGKRLANKRSTLPKPYDVLDGHSTKAEYTDTVLVQFNVDDDAQDARDTTQSERISMLLYPTEDFVHPDAKFIYTETDPVSGEQIQHTEPLRRQDLLAYSGIVLREHEVPARLSAAKVGLRQTDEERHGRGWARITLRHDEDNDGALVAEGAFQVDGEIHHLKTLDNWRRSKSYHEPDLHARHLVRNEGLVLLRDRDLDDGAFQPLKRSLALEVQSSGHSSCAHDNLPFNYDDHNPIYADARQATFNAEHGRPAGWLDSFWGVGKEPFDMSSPLVKRQGTGDVAGGNVSSNFANTIGSTVGCPKSNRVLYMGLAADCTYTASYGSTTRARTQMLTNMNAVSSIYQRTFNVSLGVIELNVQEAQCPRTVNSSVPWNTVCPEGGASGLDLNSRLSAFSQWRPTNGNSVAGLYHLLTNCSTGQEVGVAWLGTVCRVTSQQNSNTGEITSGTGVTAITPREWQVMAHEIGHNFGAIHDCSDGCASNSRYCCPLSTSTCDANAQYIMSPVSERNTSTFSPCSIGNICSALGGTVNSTCLFPPGDRSVISLQECGNGILEPGEECDPGSNSNSDCCDASTCKLRSGAQCDPDTSPCCNSSCSFASNSTVCRPAVNQACDIAETCTGNNAECPEDKTEPDGKSCGDGGLQCASGYCTSKSLQCQTLGSSLGITRACGSNQDSSCQVTCANPQSSASCIILEGQTFVDGTSCGYGGRCQNGACESGSWQNTVKSWYTNNLRISIPVTIVAGIIVLLILWGLIRCCIGRGRREHKRNQAISSQYYSAPPPPMQQQQPGYSGPGYAPPNFAPPQEPYPTYGNGQGYPR